MESEANASGGMYSEKSVCLFYDQVVVFMEEKSFLCWPVWYSWKCVPKYKILSIHTSKANPTAVFVCAILLDWIGAMLCASEDNIPLGVVLLVLSLPLWYLPCILSSYHVVLEISQGKEPVFLRILRSLLFMRLLSYIGVDIGMGGSKFVHLRTSEEPDTDHFMNYIYGPLAPQMEALHSMNHLIHDDVTTHLNPVRFADVRTNAADDVKFDDDSLNRHNKYINGNV